MRAKEQHRETRSNKQSQEGKGSKQMVSRVVMSCSNLTLQFKLSLPCSSCNLDVGYGQYPKIPIDFSEKELICLMEKHNNGNSELVSPYGS